MLAVLLNSAGLGLKSSTALKDHVLVLPYTCFTNFTSDMGILLCFRFLGGFHWQEYDVTGRSSSLTAKDDGIPLGCSWNVTGVSATRACSSADTWVQLADALKICIEFKCNKPKKKLAQQYVDK